MNILPETLEKSEKFKTTEIKVGELDFKILS